jgi:peroxiredoxin
MPRTVATRVAIAVLLSAGFATAGCTSAPSQGGDAGGSYVSGDGTVSEFAIEDRGEPITFAARTDSGEQISADQYRGQVVVVNFWYAACPPCRVEAPWLQELSEQFEPGKVQFLGVNVRDGIATAQTFAEAFGITYPSVVDTDAGVTLAFTGLASAAAVPTTVVLDREGRPAARIVGLIDKDILQTLIDDTLAEPFPEDEG